MDFCRFEILGLGWSVGEWVGVASEINVDTKPRCTWNFTMTKCCGSILQGEDALLRWCLCDASRLQGQWRHSPSPLWARTRRPDSHPENHTASPTPGLAERPNKSFQSGFLSSWWTAMLPTSENHDHSLLLSLFIFFFTGVKLFVVYYH